MKIKTSLVLTSLCFIGTITFAQTREEKVALKVCEHLNTNKIEADSIYFKILFRSLGEIVEQDKAAGISTEDMPQAKDSFYLMMQRIDSLVSLHCPTLKPLTLEQKRDKYYSLSSNILSSTNYQQGAEHMKKKEFEQALPLLLDAVKYDSMSVLAYDDLAVCERNLNKYDEAIKYYEKSLQIFPEGDFALSNLGMMYSTLNNSKKSLEYYGKVQRYYPNNPEGYYGMGINNFKLKIYEGALINFNMCYQLYTAQKSEFAAEAKDLMNKVKEQMKSEGKETEYNSIIEKYKITLQ